MSVSSRAEHIDLQRRMDELARVLRGEGRQTEATLVLTARSKMHDYKETLDRINTLTG